MTASEFDNLDNHAKAQVISEAGTLLTAIEYYARRSSLYSIGEDFFEITIDSSTGEVTNAGPCYGVDLDKFLNRINLDINRKD